MEKRTLINKFFKASNNFKFPQNIIGEYSSLSLAFIGDAVFEVYVRTHILSTGNMSPNKLHKYSAKFVNARSQAKVMQEITKYLSENEMNIVKRGRNAKSGTVPKNTQVVDYRKATGLESLFGYLYLTGDTSRLYELLDLSIKICEQ